MIWIRSFLQRIMQPYGDNLFILHGCSDFREQENIEPEAIAKDFHAPAQSL